MPTQTSMSSEPNTVPITSPITVALDIPFDSDTSVGSSTGGGGTAGVAVGDVEIFGAGGEVSLVVTRGEGGGDVELGA